MHRHPTLQASEVWLSKIDLQLAAEIAAALQSLKRSVHPLQDARVRRGSTKARTAS